MQARVGWAELCEVLRHLAPYDGYPDDRSIQRPHDDRERS